MVVASFQEWLERWAPAAEWAVASGTLLLAIATFLLARRAGEEATAVREETQVVREQVVLQRQQLASAQHAVVYPVAPREWAETYERLKAGILLKNGGTGPAFNIRGHVTFPAMGGLKRQILETTLAPDEEQLCRLDGPATENWANATGALYYGDLTEERRVTSFVYEVSADPGRLFVRVIHHLDEPDLDGE